MNLEDVQDLIYREAEYLDAQQYQPWLELFTDDAKYWIPSEETKNLTFDEASYYANINHRNKDEMKQFVSQRAVSERAWALQGLIADRLYTNIRITESRKCRAKWLLRMLEANEDAEMIYSGTSFYRFSEKKGSLKIQFKKILVNADHIQRGHLPLL